MTLHTLSGCARTSDYLNIAAKDKKKRKKEWLLKYTISGYILIRSPSFEVR